MARKSVKENILQHLPKEDSKKAQDSGQRGGLEVNVHDSYDLTTQKIYLAAHKEYIWIKNFVLRRKLKEGDEIGLLWDISKSRLQLGVISRAVPKTLADEENKI